jgi:hypothetical protein
MIGVPSFGASHIGRKEDEQGVDGQSPPAFSFGLRFSIIDIFPVLIVLFWFGWGCHHMDVSGRNWREFSDPHFNILSFAAILPLFTIRVECLHSLIFDSVVITIPYVG